MAVNRVWHLFAFFAAYYFAQGIYQSFTAFEQRYLEEFDVPLSRVSLIQALGQLPWIVKLIFAIPSDMYDCWGMGFRRPYAVVGMLAGAAALAALAGADASNFGLYLTLTLARNTGVCISDVATDGMAVDCGLEEQSGVINAVMTAGRMAGLILGSQLGGVLAQAYDFPTMIIFLSLCVAAILWVPLTLQEERKAGVHQFEWAAFRTFGQPRVALFMLAACASNMGLAMAAFPVSKWAHDRHGFTLEDIGTSSAVASAGLLVGSILNGRLFDLVNKRLAMLLAGGASSLTLMAHAWAYNRDSVLAVRFFSGFSEGALWICQAGCTMRLADKRSGASFFALAIMFMNFAIMIGSAAAGPLAEGMGLEACFYVGGAISFLQLLPLPFLAGIDARAEDVASSGQTAAAAAPGVATAVASGVSFAPTGAGKDAGAQDAAAARAVEGMSLVDSLSEAVDAGELVPAAAVALQMASPRSNEQLTLDFDD